MIISQITDPSKLLLVFLNGEFLWFLTECVAWDYRDYYVDTYILVHEYIYQRKKKQWGLSNIT